MADPLSIAASTDPSVLLYTTTFDILRRESLFAPQEKIPAIKTYEVPCLVNDVPVKAIPDTGSSIDALSEGFAKHHGLCIIRTKGRRFRLPNGQESRTIGHVDVSFRFQGEEQRHKRVFHVLSQSSEDVIVGEEFLQATGTLTVQMRRIHERVRPCVNFGSRIRLLADHDDDPAVRRRFLPCTINGQKAFALPDTGSDLMIISSEFARRCSLPICTDLRKLVYLADGSTAWTEGTVSNVELDFDIPPEVVLSGREDTDFYQTFYRNYYMFRVHSLWNALKRSEKPKSTYLMLAQNFHVMSNLPHDIILSGSFIFGHRIYTNFQHKFIEQESNITGLEDIFQVKAKEDSWRYKLKSKFRLRNGHQNPLVLTVTSPTLAQRVEDEVQRREYNERLIRKLSEPLRTKAMDQERNRRAEWEAKHFPGRSPPYIRTGLASPAGSSTSP